jgi:hypothetical protein
MTQAQLRKMSVVEYTQEAVAGEVRALWERVCQALG